MTERDTGEHNAGDHAPLSHPSVPSELWRRQTPSAVAGTSPPVGYGNIYTPHAGSMIIQVQREGGLQSRTFVLSPRQVRMLRFLTSRSGKLIVIFAAAVISIVAVEAARVPRLTARLGRMEHTAERLDTLEHALSALQKRYDQVRAMMGADTAGRGTMSAAAAAARVLPGVAASAGAAGPVPADSVASEGSTSATAVSAPITHHRRRPSPPPPTDSAPPADSGAKPDSAAEPQ